MRRYIHRIIPLFLILASITAEAQVILMSPKANEVVPINVIAVTVVGKANAEVDLYINDSFVRMDTVRVDGMLDFLNVNVPYGPVNVKVLTTNAAGREFATERAIHVLGPAHHVVALDDSISLPADGFTEATFRLQIQDQWGYRLDRLKIATLDVEAGEILNEDLDPSQAAGAAPTAGI